MGRLIVEQIVTADGYAADVNGGIDFMNAVEVEDPTDRDQLGFLAGVDAILLGANTYRMFSQYWPNADPTQDPVAEPINRLPKFVVSNTLTDAPWGESGSVEILRGNPTESVAALKNRYRAIVVWGSLTLTDALFGHGLVDELRLRVVPVLIGDGRSFTPAGLGERRLALDHVVSHPSGHVGVTYHVR
jgi:dihydrofolate reductase